MHLYLFQHNHIKRKTRCVVIILTSTITLMLPKLAQLDVIPSYYQQAAITDS